MYINPKSSGLVGVGNLAVDRFRLVFAAGLDGRTNAGREPRGINRKRPMIHGGHTGKGVHAEQPGANGVGIHQRTARQKPRLSGDTTAQGSGIFTHEVQGKRPHLSGRGTEIGVHGDEAYSGLYSYFEALAARLRRVRVCCGDWKRITGPSVTVKHGVCGVFLDPPYDMRVVSNTGSGRDGAAPTDGLYSSHDNELSADVRAWAIENGSNPLLRIALCGYEEEHTFPPTWECIRWKAHGGYGSQRGDRGYENAARERIWFSPHCLKPPTLFNGVDVASTEPTPTPAALSPERSEHSSTGQTKEGEF